MRLIECHIENFGKISNRTLDFQENLHVICEENGWGKSTLASFIKVMFYGFENDSKRDAFENDRKRYKPWQGGVYGGSLTFEAGGKEYTISRTFGAKEKEDTFDLRDRETNLPSTAFSSDVGQELFQIDCESFGRTVFLSQNDCETFSTAGIDAKIGNLAENTNDLNNYETANDRLTQMMNGLTNKRVTGKCKQLEQEVSRLSHEIRVKDSVTTEVNSVSARLAENKEKEAKLKEYAKRLQAERADISRFQDSRGKLERYEILCREAKEREADYRKAKSLFPGKIPDEQELATYIHESEALSAKEAEVALYTLSKEEEDQLKMLGEVFQAGCPGEAQLDTAERQLCQLQDIKLQMASRQVSEEERNQYQRYEEQFGSGVPNEWEIDSKINKWNQWESRKAEYERRRSGRKEFVTLMSCTCMALLLGIIILFIQPVIGIFMIAVGISLGVFVMIRKALDHGKETELFLLSVEEEIREFLERYGIGFNESTVMESLYDLKKSIRDYDLLSRRVAAAQGDGLYEKKEQIQRELDVFLGEYGYDINMESPEERIRTLREQIRRFKELTQRKEKHKNSQKIFISERERIAAYIAGLGIEVPENMSACLREISMNLKEYHITKREYENAVKSKDAFEKQYDVEALNKLKSQMSEDRTLGDVDGELRRISDELEILGEHRKNYERLLQAAEEHLDEITVLEEELEEKKDELKETSLKLQYLEKTANLLREAKEEFTAEYMEPIHTAFGRYLGMIAGEIGLTYRFDANSRLTIDESGAQRETRFFSAGYRDLLGICMRMALVDVMYKGEKPFIIMDDPFVNLDDNKTEGAMEFLQKISEEYHIIYFTCHNALT